MCSIQRADFTNHWTNFEQCYSAKSTASSIIQIIRSFAAVLYMIKLKASMWGSQSDLQVVMEIWHFSLKKKLKGKSGQDYQSYQTCRSNLMNYVHNNCCNVTKFIGTAFKQCRLCPSNERTCFHISTCFQSKFF